MASGNIILDKNLECIEKYNPQLKEKLLNLPYLTNDIQLIETNCKEPNLSYNGLPLHRQNGAELEAKELFKKSENTTLCINIIFGMGLGYLFKEFCEQAKGDVILYEQNLEILRVTLELVDFSKELSQTNVKIASDFKELRQVLQYIYQPGTEIDIMFLDSYKTLCLEEIDKTIKELQMLKASFSSDTNLITAKGLDFMLFVINNISDNLEAIPLKELKDIYKNKTALVISAGPTLDSNLETIKKNRDKAVIFCVGPALKSLISNGITPDFVNIIETEDVSGQVNDLSLSEINLILAPFVNPAIYKLNPKQKLLFPSSTTRGGQYWAHLSGEDISEYMSRGTVSSDALYSAKMLGCNKLVLVGQDLAFLNNSCYSESSAYSDIKFKINPETKKPEYDIKDWKNFAKHVLPMGFKASEEDYKKAAEAQIKIFNDKLCFVKGISGEILPTTSDYAMFIDVFKEFAQNNENLALINTSMLGAQIDGFENIPLEEALKDATYFERKSLPKIFKYNSHRIFENLANEKAYFETILKKFEKTKEHFKKFDKEIQLKKIVTQEAYKNYMSIISIYDEISLKHFKNNQFYRIISTEEHFAIQNYVVNTKDNDEQKIKHIYALLKIYFNNVEEKILKIICALEEQIKVIRKNNI